MFVPNPDIGLTCCWSCAAQMDNPFYGEWADEMDAREAQMDSPFYAEWADEIRRTLKDE